MILPLSFTVTQLHAVEGAGHHVTIREAPPPPQMTSNAPAPQRPAPAEFTIPVEPFVFADLHIGQEFGLQSLSQKPQQILSDFAQAQQRVGGGDCCNPAPFPPGLIRNR